MMGDVLMKLLNHTKMGEHAIGLGLLLAQRGSVGDSRPSGTTHSKMCHVGLFPQLVDILAACLFISPYL